MKGKSLASLIIFLLLLITEIKSQNLTIAKLRTELSNATTDSSRFCILDSLSIYYILCSDKIDSSYFFANESINLSSPLADKRHLILSYARMGLYYSFAGKYGASLQALHKGIVLSEQTNFYAYSSILYLTGAELYTFLNQFNKAKSYLRKAESYLKFSEDPFYNIRARTYDAFSLNFLFSGEFDSATISLRKAEESFNNHPDLLSEDMYLAWMAMLKTHSKEYKEAKQYLLKGIEAVRKNDDHQLPDFMYYQYANILQSTSKSYEAIVQAKLGLMAAKAINDMYFLVLISKTISVNYERLGEKDSTLFYLKMNADYYARLDSARNVGDVETSEFSERLHLQEIAAQSKLTEEKDTNRLRQFAFAAGLLILVSISMVMWRTSVTRKKAFSILSQQKAQIELQKSRTEQTLLELKATQAQLIQSEKMASLGELTAGIAHEIQNPLNFVNNFSEVNKEMIAELKEEINNGNYGEVKILANDIEANSEKINHHGRRADSIVKGMLQHSQRNNGIKEPTDINALADEYLRLSYHGLRAKDKSFNATMNTNFDEKIGKINIVPQDIGRVVLNLYNNAFYAVNEKKRIHGESYDPMVSVSTKMNGDKIEIRVADNGNGIPQKVIDKIFQPFFTTKPTGQGTGLGLSLSYDIIKAHGGEIKVETKEGEFTEFVIQLPL